MVAPSALGSVHAQASASLIATRRNRTDFSRAVQSITQTLGQLLRDWDASTGAADEVEEPGSAPTRPAGATLEDVQLLSPAAFERWVGNLFRERGYRVRRTGTHGTGGDHGIDLLVANAGERAVVQCKNFRAWSVGEPAIRDLFGVMHAAGADRAYLVTTGRVTAPAWRWASGKPIEIWDHRALRRVLAESREETQPLRATIVEVAQDSTGNVAAGATACPRCGGELLVRRNRHNGDKFLGCSSFPRCRFTQPLTAPLPNTHPMGEAMLLSNRSSDRPRL